MNAVHVDELYIGTAENNGTWTYAKLCAGIEGFDPAENEQNQQYFFMCGNGFAHNVVTGLAPEIVLTGRRIVGDTAQDYIAGKQWKIGEERNSSVKIIAEGQQIIADCTISAIKSFGGQALDVNQFGCTIRINGEPTVTPVT